MITTYHVEGGRLVVAEALQPPAPEPQRAGAAPAQVSALPVWIDLLMPLPQEERIVERLIGVGSHDSSPKVRAMAASLASMKP